MSTPKSKLGIDELIQSGDWVKARNAIVAGLRSDPENHWLLAQRGVTYYEQGEYQRALRELARAAEIVPDCPLTLWNLAGTLGALGKPREALEIYTWLAFSRRTAADDACWESDEWADSLRTDCFFRAAACYEQLGDPKTAELFYRRYLRLLSLGSNGTYPAEDALRRILAIHDASAALTTAARKEIRKVSREPVESKKLPIRGRLPKIDPEVVLAD